METKATRVPSGEIRGVVSSAMLLINFDTCKPSGVVINKSFCPSRLETKMIRPKAGGKGVAVADSTIGCSIVEFAKAVSVG